MKEVTVNQPHFAVYFKCTGSACIDHCCKEWEISFDKTTVNRYLKSRQINIKTIATSRLEMTKKSNQHWATMTMDDSRTCAFMDKNALCKIHTQLGHDALSSTCASYPRITHRLGNEENNSLMLSCPEAARLLLTDAQAMRLHTKIRRNFLLTEQQAINPWHKLINVMAMHLVKASGNLPEQGLYALASLMLLAQKLDQRESHGTERLEEACFALLQALENGNIGQTLQQMQPDYQLQWSLLLRLQVYLDNCVATRASGRLGIYVKRLLRIQTEEISSNDVSRPVTRHNAAWQCRVMPWLAERPYLISNYLQYRIFTGNFPGDGVTLSLKPLYLLTAEWYLIKSLIAASAEICGEINETDVVNIIYSFHSVTKHNNAAVAAFYAEIDKVRVNDDLSLLYLLK
ncbi:hypothetical protein BL250_14125 [Erwinia sp. OLTSP20]|uniref:flagellin lysine-N-methylase n=1 Tax=unclassified Erwinia TaxID=2622719 RepID=UPI000C1A7751|nr:MULTISPECIES: flagellin lysine-N-methylase [unclassified Erwinia]PIJ48341.1 hypothetical protein BV501_17485 [Erwinia sp. OAMSP11]PIJ68694.1 hypothetical protein BK416_16210 [Erwinia sp. OLSSP12]PIJ78842.1 hypothetical protein BLD47_16430 [Erwinia sp. OLCASP19]PIJ79812.1 hypothetical protein BLD46_16550 [Erwinia sp. OLMTSP26]PIJ81217.1 hypothetical protein BLD49_16685 [Erwinia sp. OLMDSP33]